MRRGSSKTHFLYVKQILSLLSEKGVMIKDLYDFFPFSVHLYEMPTCWFSFYQMSFQTTRAVCPCQRVTPMRHNYSYLSTKDARFLRIVRRWVYTAVTPRWTTTYSASRLRPSLTQTVASPSSSPLVKTSWYCLHWGWRYLKYLGQRKNIWLFQFA